ncbi:MAG: hypothetical protein ACN6P8_21585 [Achromobacter piechaudii]
MEAVRFCLGKRQRTRPATGRFCDVPNSVSESSVAADTKQRKMPGFQLPHASLMNLDRLRREFPSFDISTLPPLPEGYIDSSSYIDAAPSFENVERGLKVYIDFANYSDRESGRSQRFCVSRYDEDEGDYEDVALSTNDWAEVVRFLTA